MGINNEITLLFLFPQFFELLWNPCAKMLYSTHYWTLSSILLITTYAQHHHDLISILFVALQLGEIQEVLLCALFHFDIFFLCE